MMNLQSIGVRCRLLTPLTGKRSRRESRRQTMESKQDIRDPFERISAETAKQMIDRGGVVVVDVREPAEWAQGRIPEAVHIPLGTVLNRPQELPQDGLIFVCAEGVRL